MAHLLSKPIVYGHVWPSVTKCQGFFAATIKLKKKCKHEKDNVLIIINQLACVSHFGDAVPKQRSRAERLCPKPRMSFPLAIFTCPRQPLNHNSSEFRGGRGVFRRQKDATWQFPAERYYVAKTWQLHIESPPKLCHRFCGSPCQGRLDGAGME